MFLSNFIKFLLPTFEKDRLISDLRVTRGELVELQAAYGVASKLLKNWKFQNEDVADKVASFKRIMSTGDNPVVWIDDHLNDILKNLQQLEDIAVSILGNSVSGSGLTYKQASIVKYSDAMFLVAKYARKFLNWIYVLETSHFGSSKQITDSISKYELKWLDETLVDFCNALKSTSSDPAKVATSLMEIPEIQVSASDPESLRATMGESKLDPLKLGFIASKANPIYYIRMLVAEFQVRRYKEMKEELSLLQLRRMNLEKLKAGKQDANLERQIEYVESRAQKLSYEISEMEAGK
jgi:hypothetical protein